MATILVPAEVKGSILVCEEGLSVWGGVDPASGRIIDEHHPQFGASVADKVVLMPSSRGSCTGSGVLLELALSGVAPKALVFRSNEDILTLGALIATRLFNRPIAVLRLNTEEYAQLAAQSDAVISANQLKAGNLELTLLPMDSSALSLTDHDLELLAGHQGEAARIAMDIIATMAVAQGARQLIDVSRGHIDACIYAAPALLTFAQAMADKGGQVRIPTTMNAISVDHANWRAQGVAESFGLPASQLADAYVRMGAKPSFTCAPYLLEQPPGAGEDIAWAESNAVIYANSVLGARTVKHADFMDLCIALTGRAAKAGVYLDEQRAAQRIIDVELPDAIDDAFWPMLGWLVGQASPDRIPLLRGLELAQPSSDDLKALCAAFGTSSASPMLHIAGITPEADHAPAAGADGAHITLADFHALWQRFNRANTDVDLVALGSPHFSAQECSAFADLMEDGRAHPAVTVIITLGRATLDAIRHSGVLARLQGAGVTVVSDLCWCSISEPVFPPAARVLMTNSGKYAHYAPSLSARAVRFGSLRQCAETARTGRAPQQPPAWLARPH